MFNQIIYFDWYIQAGLSNLGTALDTRSSSSLAASYKNENFVGFLIGTGHHYYLSDRFSIRMDFLGTIYQAPSFGDVGDKTLYSNYTFNLGLGFRL